MRYPTGNTKREENFLDGLRGLILTPEDWERYLHTYRLLGGRLARIQVRAELDTKWINDKLEAKEAELNG